MPVKLQERLPTAKSRVYEEFNMTPKSISQDIAALKDWLIKQPHLPYIRGENGDKWLENYLVLNKNSLEKVKESLDMYFSVRVLLPEIYSLKDPLHRDIQKSCATIAIAVLPKLTPEGRRVVVFSHFKDTAEDFEPSVMFKRTTMINDIILQEGVDFIGLELIVDTQNVVWGHMAKYSPSLTKKAFDYAMKAYPNRYHKIHIVNPWPLLDTALSIFKPMVPKKIQNRLITHKTLDELYQHLPKNILPKDLGGEEPTIKELNDAWQEKMVEYRDWFLSSESIKSDETKRIGKCRSELSTETFGNQGSFRKIEVD